MRVLAVIAPPVGAGLIILIVLTELAQDLSRLSYHSPPDLDNSDDWDVALDEFDDTVQGVVRYTELMAGQSISHRKNAGLQFPRELERLRRPAFGIVGSIA
jgi:hypothetical protein